MAILSSLSIVRHSIQSDFGLSRGLNGSFKGSFNAGTATKVSVANLNRLPLRLVTRQHYTFQADPGKLLKLRKALAILASLLEKYKSDEVFQK